MATLKASASHQLTALRATADKDHAATKNAMEKKLAALQVAVEALHGHRAAFTAF